MSDVKKLVKKSRADLSEHPRIRIYHTFACYCYYDVTTNKVDRKGVTGLPKYCKGYLGEYSKITNKYLDF